MQVPISIKLSEKEYLKIPLFRNVRQINGQKIFKQLCQSCKIYKYNNRYMDKQLSLKQNFIYVKEGQILVYKKGLDINQKCLIKSYKSQQYCGFQDYPLFWGQELIVQVNNNSTLIITQLGYFYRFFRRVIPMTYLQTKAQYLKKLPLFRGVQLQKIFKLACLSQKYRIQKDKILIREGEQFQNIFIICNGKLELKSTLIKQPIYCGQNQDFLVKEVKQGIQICYFTAKCIAQSDVLAIPKQQFKKVIDIRFKLHQTLPKQVKQCSIAQDDMKSQKQSFSQFAISKVRSRTMCSRGYNDNRPRTAKIVSESQTNQNIYQRTSQSKSRKNQTQKQQETYDPQFKSLGEIQLLKFIRRKQKSQSKNFYQYIESRAPQIVLNPSKQFALIKPFYKSNSQYVRNMKRKMKKTMSISTSVNLSTHFNDFTL